MNWLRNQLTALLTACALTCTALVSPVGAMPVGGNLLQNSYIPPNNSVFVPCTIIAGYTAWYNPSTLQHTGSVVTSWSDASANGYNITTANASPVYSASGGPNGLPSMQLNGTNQYLSSSVVIMSNLVSTTAYTIYAVFQITSYTGANNTNFSQTGSVFQAATSAEIGMGTGSSDLLAGHKPSGGQVTQVGPATSTGITVIVEMYYDGTNINLRVNGTGYGPTAAGSVGNLGGDLQIGADVALAHFFKGYISELIFYNTTLSSGNRTTMRTCLGSKYNGTG